MPDFICNLSERARPLKHVWEHTVGSDHAPVALRADWQSQLQRCHEELGFRHIRFHGLLCDDMGTLIVHNDKLLYSFFNADQIIDFLLSIGMKPFVELSFMPQALASGSTTVFRYRANVTPPRDGQQWATLIGTLVGHWVSRYGVEEVRTWFFEVWNEPNLKDFWTGTQQDYFDLYRQTAEAIKAVDAQLKVGGPATATNEWIEEFLAFCDRQRLPADFVSTHHYPTDALGNEDQDTETQLSNSRRSILREQVQATHRRARGRPVYYTEWNTSSNPRDPRHDEPYAAAFIVKTVLEASDLVEGYSFWTFSDIFEENYFPSVPFHGGFGLLNLHGIPKPAYRAFELLHRLGTDRLLVDGLHDTVDAWVVRKPAAVSVLLANHALPRHPIETQQIHVRLTDTRTQPRRAYVERIDEDHANAKRHWREMGEPDYLSAGDVERLQAASRLVQEPQCWAYEDGVIHLELALPPHAVAAITVEFAPASSEEDGVA
jgi:xylan 1,4-beta-xylosidase